MSELQKYRLSMDIQIPKGMRRESVEEYIRSQIFVKGWGESFKSNFIHADRFSFTPASTEPMYLISGPEISAAEKSLFGFRNDRKAWADRIVARGPVAQPAPVKEPEVKYPNSTELLLMANTEWKNRIERKHTHDVIPWVDGWIHGFLTPHPEWKKRSQEHDASIAAQERERIFKILSPFEWAGTHTDYEDSWGVMTVACPFCFNAKKDGHKPDCVFESLRSAP